MGLDQYAMKLVRGDNRDKGGNLTDVDFWPTVASDTKWPSFESACFHQWRKHADLNGWMQKLYHKKGGTATDYVYVRLDSDDIDLLEREVNALPTATGFFWGNSCYEHELHTLDFIDSARRTMAQGNDIYYTANW